MVRKLYHHPEFINSPHDINPQDGGIEYRAYIFVVIYKCIQQEHWKGFYRHYKVNIVRILKKKFRI